MRGVDAAGRAVALGSDGPDGPGPLAGLTVPQLRALIIRILRAGGASRDDAARATRCSTSQLHRDARTPVPGL